MDSERLNRSRTTRRRARCRLLLVLGLGLGSVLALIPAAGAEEVTGAELRALAERAATDSASRERLERVDRVDGRPVDLAGALRGASGDEAERRLAVLAGQVDGAAAPPGPAAGPMAAAPMDAGEARRRAEAVLEQRRFHPSRIPKPFRGVLRWLGARLEHVAGPIVRLYRRVIENTPLAVVLLTAVLLALTAVVRSLVRRRLLAVAARGEAGSDRTRRERPEDLERAAEEAEARGDAGLAFRLRFRAGILRLALQGAVPDRASATTGELRRGLRSAPFDELAGAFEEIAYGGRAGDEADLRLARERWPAVLAGRAGPGRVGPGRAGAGR